MPLKNHKEFLEQLDYNRIAEPTIMGILRYSAMLKNAYPNEDFNYWQDSLIRGGRAMYQKIKNTKPKELNQLGEIFSGLFEKFYTEDEFFEKCKESD